MHKKQHLRFFIRLLKVRNHLQELPSRTLNTCQWDTGSDGDVFIFIFLPHVWPWELLPKCLGAKVGFLPWEVREAIKKKTSFFWTLSKSALNQCYQAKNQTMKSQNQTFIRPYFYQKSDQNRTQTLYFEGKIRLVPKTLFRHKANQLLFKKFQFFTEMFK